MQLKRSLAPVINNDTRVLILGSMPGEESLRQQQYYAYPQNHFWKIIAAVFRREDPVEYDSRIEMLTAGRIGLWDVISTCRREGSLDTNIRDEEPNDISLLLEQHPSVKAVCFNGQKAAASFRKNFGLNIFDDGKIEYLMLPSTSPANTIGFERKFEKWKKIDFFLRF